MPWEIILQHSPGIGAVLATIFLFLKFLKGYQDRLAERHVAYFHQLERMTDSTNKALSEVTNATTRLYTLLDHFLTKQDKH